jgi:hypothetical protein
LDAGSIHIQQTRDILTRVSTARATTDAVRVTGQD